VQETRDQSGLGEANADRLEAGAAPRAHHPRRVEGAPAHREPVEADDEIAEDGRVDPGGGADRPTDVRAGRDADDVGRPGDAQGAVLRSGAARAHPDGHGHARLRETAGERVEPSVGDHRSAAVQLDDQRLDPRAFRGTDRVDDEVDLDGIDEPGHLDHVDPSRRRSRRRERHEAAKREQDAR
jgi:hypothetical protein